MKLKLILSSLLLLTICSVNAKTRFVILSDVHVDHGNKNEEMLIKAVDEINGLSNVDLVIMNGDLTNEGSDAQLNNIKSILDKIKQPSFVLPGNHENNWSQSATKTFIDLWGNDRFITEKNNLVIVGANCGPFMKMGDGHVKQEDLHWLKSTLEERVKPGKKVVSFNHYPLRKDDLDNYVDYIRVLEQFPTIIHINGHYHVFKPYMSGGIQSMMVTALDLRDGTYGYTIMDIDDNNIKFYKKLIGSEPQLIETFTINTNPRPLKIDSNIGEYTQPEGFTVEKIWTDSASIFTRLGFDANNIYFGNSLGFTKAIDKKTGTENWSVPTGASLFSRPVAAKNRVIVPAGVHKLLFLDPKNGKTIGEAESAGPYAADGLVSNGYLYQGGYKKFEKWNPSSMKLIWRYDSLNNYCQAAPVVDGNEVFFGAWDTNLRCLDTKTGKLKWVWNNGKSANMLGPGNVVPVVTSDKIIIVAPDRVMTAINRSTGKTIWRNNDHKYRESLGVSADNKTAYAKTMDGELVAVDITGNEFKELWTLDMGIGYDHAPCIVLENNGVVYAGSRRGIITAVDPMNKKVIWQLPVGVSEINGFDVDPTTGDVYASLIEGTIFKIHKK